MLECIFDIIRWIICKLLFRNHCYSIIYNHPQYENIMVHKCIICGDEYETVTKGDGFIN